MAINAHATGVTTIVRALFAVAALCFAAACGGGGGGTSASGAAAPVVPAPAGGSGQASASITRTVSEVQLTPGGQPVPEP
jgi:hypothetical protein